MPRKYKRNFDFGSIRKRPFEFMGGNGTEMLPKKVKSALKTAEKVIKTVTETKTRKKTKPKFSTASNSKFSGTIKPKKKRDDNSYNVDGTTLRLEGKGSVTSTECAYVGHATIAPRKLLDQMCRLIVKELMKQRGEPIQSWSDSWSVDVLGTNTGTTGWAISYNYMTRTNNSTYSSDENPLPANHGVSVNPQASYDDIAKALASDFCSTFQNFSQHRILSISLIKYAANGVQEAVAKVYPNQFYITLNCTSILKFQNCTKGRDDGDADDDEDDVGFIEANPLNYKSYDRLTQNGFHYTFQKSSGYGSTTTAVNFVGSDGLGIIQYDPVAYQIKALYHPPLHSALIPTSNKKFKVTTAKGVIQPGDIKRSFLSFKKRFTFNQLMNILQETFVDSCNYIVKGVSKARLFALEHTLKNSTDQAITIPWELDLVMRCKYFYRPKIATEDVVEII